MTESNSASNLAFSRNFRFSRTNTYAPSLQFLASRNLLGSKNRTFWTLIWRGSQKAQLL